VDGHCHLRDQDGVLADQRNAEPIIFGQINQNTEHFVLSNRVEARCWLVGEEHARARQKGTQQGKEPQFFALAGGAGQKHRIEPQTRQLWVSLSGGRAMKPGYICQGRAEAGLSGKGRNGVLILPALLDADSAPAQARGTD
jgi:hypothetical protein